MNKKILSIQLSLGGLYFSPAEFQKFDKENFIAAAAEAIDARLADGAYDAVEIALDSPITITVPYAFFAAGPGLADSLLRANNATCDESQSVLMSPPVNDMVAVMVWDGPALDPLKEKYGEMLTFTSPLLQNLPLHETDTVIVRLTSRNAYISAWKQVLVYGEVLPYKSMADLLYYLQSIDRNYGIKKDRMIVLGHNAEEMAKLLGSYYKTSVHADNKR